MLAYNSGAALRLLTAALSSPSYGPQQLPSPLQRVTVHLYAVQASCRLLCASLPRCPHSPPRSAATPVRRQQGGGNAVVPGAFRMTLRHASGALRALLRLGLLRGAINRGAGVLPFRGAAAALHSRRGGASRTAPVLLSYRFRTAPAGAQCPPPLPTVDASAATHSPRQRETWPGTGSTRLRQTLRLREAVPSGWPA